jgi:CRP/FNR family transcriptional regulator
MDDGDLMSVSAEAVTETQLAYLPRERIAAFVHSHPETAVRFLGALSRELALARRKVRELALKRADSRLAGVLLDMSDDRERSARDTLELRLTRRELAEMIGVSTETAIRLLAKLRRKGVISVSGRDIRITDRERLARLAQLDETNPDESGAGEALDETPSPR